VTNLRHLLDVIRLTSRVFYTLHIHISSYLRLYSRVGQCEIRKNRGLFLGLAVRGPPESAAAASRTVGHSCAESLKLSRAVSEAPVAFACACRSGTRCFCHLLYAVGCRPRHFAVSGGLWCEGFRRPGVFFSFGGATGASSGAAEHASHRTCVRPDGSLAASSVLQLGQQRTTLCSGVPPSFAATSSEESGGGSGSCFAPASRQPCGCLRCTSSCSEPTAPTSGPMIEAVAVGAAPCASSARGSWPATGRGCQP
jgi:hypothetical protein